MLQIICLISFFFLAESFTNPLTKTIASINNYINNNNNNLIKDKKLLLAELVSQCQPNGIKASSILRREIEECIAVIESKNPTKSPANSFLMNGFWRMTYTDFSPAAPSSGQLGAFVGVVYQDLDSLQKKIVNLLKIDFPFLSIKGGLVAKQNIKNSNTWEIEFERVGNIINGFKLPPKQFIPKDQIRLWEITYLDDELRIMRARKPESSRDDSFIFVLVRDEKNRFFVDL